MHKILIVIMIGQLIACSSSNVGPDSNSEASCSIEYSSSSGNPDIQASSAKILVSSSSLEYSSSLVYSSSIIGVYPSSSANFAPAIGAVEIRGVHMVGYTLTGDYLYTDLDGDLEGETIVQWQRNDTDIPSEHSLSYRVTSDDVGQSISLKITPIALSGDSMVGIPRVSKSMIIYDSINHIVDVRDSNIYKTVLIGSQLWLAENMNYETDQNSYCYNDDFANCDLYGRLYSWNAAAQACPSEWHLPSLIEWEQVVSTIADSSGLNTKVNGDYSTVGPAVKKVDAWLSSDDATDIMGLSLMPGGRKPMGGIYQYAGTNGWWWASTETDEQYAKLVGVGSGDGYLRFLLLFKTNHFSVRCVKD